MNININSKNWTYYLSRPMSLLEVSLWHLFYSSEYTLEILGKIMPDVLFIEEPKGICQHYRIKQQLDAYLNNLKNLVLEDQTKIKKLIEEGFSLIEEAKDNINNPKMINSIDSAALVYCRLGLQTAHLPRVALNIYEDKQIKPDFIGSIEKIRTITIYPEFFEKVIIPLSVKILEKNNVSNSVAKAELITLNELKTNVFSKLEERLSYSIEGKLFLYEMVDGEENVEYSAENKLLVNRLNHIESFKTRIMKGAVAYPGKVTGRVRVILDVGADPLKPGEILVTINSTPELSKYITDCSAIITDEGGLGCHAATISREFKIPCVIGTKIATKVLKDGDTVEVDADKGMVKILNICRE